MYVRGLSSALARSGAMAHVFTRRVDPSLPASTTVEPGFVLHHIDAGAAMLLPLQEQESLVDAFADGVRKRIAEVGRVDLLHANYWLSGLVGQQLKQQDQIPLATTFHTLARVKAKTIDVAESAHRDAAELAVMQCADVVFASGVAEQADLLANYPLDAHKIGIVSPGVEHAFFSPGDQGQARRALGLRRTGRLLLFVGRIQPLKGLDVAIRTLASLDPSLDTRLVVVGGPSGVDGPGELARCRNLAAALGVADRVVFTPPQPHHLLSTFYRASDVVLVPSRTESFGLVALEAAACGIPVVARAVGGLTELVRHGVTGLLVDDPSARAFATATTSLLDDRVLSDAFAAQATHHAESFTWRNAADSLLSWYGRVLERGLTPCP